MAPRDANLLKSSISLVGLQLFSRLFTFGLNQTLFRLVSPSAYGTAAIQFEFMLSTILFLSREGVRNTLLRAHEDKMKAKSGVTNLSFLPIALGIPLAILMTSLYGTHARREVQQQPHFTISIWIYALAAFVELLSEPMHNTAMSELRTDVRVKAEGLGVTVKTVLTFLVLYYDSRHPSGGDVALLAFALGQLSYSVCVVAKYIAHYGARHLVPKISPHIKDKGQALLDPSLLGLSMSMTIQSVVKHFLTEGDKFILSWFSPLQDQGGYAIAVNYGSLIARIGFQPVEETLRVFFSRTLSPPIQENTSAALRPKQEGLITAARTLISLLAIQISFSLLLIAFAPPYLPLLLRVLLPPRYLETSAPIVLRAWIYYIPFLAINGGLEAFVSSVARPTDLARQSRFMALFSALYISTAVAFYRFTTLGDASLVYANIINLSARIAYCIHFTSRYYSSNNSKQILSWPRASPPIPFLLATVVSGWMVRMNSQEIQVAESDLGLRFLFRRGTISHIGYGAALSVICLSIWWKTQAHFISMTLPRKKES
ncbi:hypothetical protein AMATHDRAFT_64553 [Amanita thiersii Skay4041]|uniref:Man(5)GlcNAc(2)-PP-dolichol translocation protein RFT1 n=1 Tax=Amanita thiersii Skay4041 TaxID=703135 RepID=A0A2A9NME7_9AGAR|nr:hypothetical protein AMATHDRAFT_64553 [Amanita thiersii Skay4041]